MGMKNFVPSNPDDDDQNPGGNGFHTTVTMVGGPPPSAGGGADPADAALELLIDYNDKFASAAPAQFRDQLIEQTLAVLIGRTKPNALLVGSAGVGKTKIVEDIARRIVAGDQLIPEQLREHTIYELPLSNVVAGSGHVGDIEQKVKSVVDFASDPANKAILFMDEIHQLASGSNPIYSKIAQILKPALARGEMRVIGATTSQESRDLDSDPAFSRRFSRLVVDELTRSQTLTVLENLRPDLVAHYRHEISVSDEVLAEVVKVADENSRAGAHRPDSAITLLDRAMADRVLEQRRLIADAEAQGNQMLVQALKASGLVPLTGPRVLAVAKRLLTGNAKRHDFEVSELALALEAGVRGQSEVHDQLVDRLAREELSLFPRTTPVAWMFAGASGVGKTETAKLIAQHATGQDPIILNMTEYNSPAAVNRIIGSQAGYVGYDSNEELPFDSLESNPHRLILLDEFEKCDAAVQRLFLSALDEGSLRTSRGRVIDFSRAIVVATTNAARDELAHTPVGFNSGVQTLSHKSLTKALGQYFDAELLGRFTLVVGFAPITAETYQDVLVSHYERSRAAILESNPRLAQALPEELPEDERHRLQLETYVPSLGARPAVRAIRTWIEDQVIAARQATALGGGVLVGASASSD